MYNISFILHKMDDPPKGQKLYRVFDGEWNLISKEQIENIREIMVKAHEELIIQIDYILTNDTQRI